MSTMADLGDSITAHNKNIVYHQTWGHLGPEKKRYYGQMLVAHSAYGDITIIDDKFDGLQNSPWQCTAINDIAFELLKDEDIGVYTLIGWIEWTKNDDDSISCNTSGLEIIKIVSELE